MSALLTNEQIKAIEREEEADYCGCDFPAGITHLLSHARAANERIAAWVKWRDDANRVLNEARGRMVHAHNCDLVKYEKKQIDCGCTCYHKHVVAEIGRVQALQRSIM